MIKSGQCSYTEEWCGGKAAFILEVTDIWQFCCCRSKISKKKKKSVRVQDMLDRENHSEMVLESRSRNYITQILSES